MPGGNKKINGEDGKQFTSEYQPQEKWTEDKAKAVGVELIEWLKSEHTNIFFEEFLIIENDYPEQLIKYLSKKFSSFSLLIERAKAIQKLRLQKYGALDELNASVTKFLLINNHNMAERTEVKSDIEVKGIEPITWVDNAED